MGTIIFLCPQIPNTQAFYHGKERMKHSADFLISSRNFNLSIFILFLEKKNYVLQVLGPPKNRVRKSQKRSGPHIEELQISTFAEGPLNFAELISRSPPLPKMQNA